MVRHRLLIVLLAVALCSVIVLNSALAQTREYHLGQEWVKIWINSDGSIDLFYNISLTLDSGPDINYILVGQPKGDFTIGNDSAIDQYGNALQTKDGSSGSDFKVQVSLNSPLAAGQTVWFTVMTNVGHMIYEDNETNVGMLFKPTWWSEATVTDLRMLIVLPNGVQPNQVGTAEIFWDGILPEAEGQWAVFWEKKNLVPDQKYEFGVSFPKGYTSFEQKATGLAAFFNEYGSWLAIFFVLLAIIIIVVVVVRKKGYSMPKISMETLGMRRGLTAVEASYLLDMKPPMIVTEILYSLLQKRAVWVESTKPSIKLKIMEAFKNKKGTDETPLRYYEIDFLDTLKENGTLDEEKLAGTIMYLRDAVEEKMRGYNRNDTVDYYRQIAAKAWEQVEGAGTPDLASNAYDEQLLWLFLDPNYKTRTETAFQDRIFQPNPMWFWYWYGYQQYHPNPTYRPNIETPMQSGKAPSIPGADFANNIAKSVENTSNSIVVNMEKFANAILPFSSAKASHEPAHENADCVCACATCACACACVSCACACAGGGVGIKGDGLKP
jgi:hypothetical protein